jgi:circadian clock protein KaiC
MPQDRVPVGIPGLDYLLKGGLIPNASIMVEGTPGTGKSTLGMQFIAAGVAMGHPGVLVTLEEYPSEFYRDALNYGWDFVRWEKEDLVRVVATSPEALKQQIELGGPLSTEIRTIGAKRIVVDSVTHFERISTDPGFLRTALSGLIHAFKIQDMLSLFTKDIESPGALEFWGRYSVDVLIELSFRLMKERERHRFIEIHKARGQDHILGRNTFKISNHGIEIFPRATPEMLSASISRAAAPERMSSGLEGFDQMLGGGFLSGQSVLLAGTAGTGKSLTAASFTNAGIQKGEGTLYISTEDAPVRIIQNAASVGLDLRPGIESGLLEMVYLPPVELSPDEMLCYIQSHLETGKFRRLVLDSITSLRGVTPEPEYLRDVIHALANVCSKRDIAGLFIAEIEEMTGPFRFTPFGGSFIADAVILFRLIEVSGELRKAISIIKMRSSHHDNSLRELIFTSSGLKIGALFENLAGLLTGTPTAQRPIGVEPYFGELLPEEQRIVAILAEHKEATAAEVAREAGIDVERTREVLDKLTEAGYITHIGAEEDARYRPSLMRAH